MDIVARRHAYSTLQLRFTFMRGLHPFFPPRLEVCTPPPTLPLMLGFAVGVRPTMLPRAQGTCACLATIKRPEPPPCPPPVHLPARLDPAPPPGPPHAGRAVQPPHAEARQLGPVAVDGGGGGRDQGVPGGPRPRGAPGAHTWSRHTPLPLSCHCRRRMGWPARHVGVLMQLCTRALGSAARAHACCAHGVQQAARMYCWMHRR